jgi:hypothetical protein
MVAVNIKGAACLRSVACDRSSQDGLAVATDAVMFVVTVLFGKQS